MSGNSFPEGAVRHRGGPQPGEPGERATGGGSAEPADPSAEEESRARGIAGELFGARAALMNRYVDILTSRGVDWGLLGPREPARLWSRHILNCSALTQLIPQGSSVIDVGSGAGLPGLVVGVLRPDLRITLLEPLLRRSNFLVSAVEELGLGESVRVVRERAEDHGFCYDVVTARAVARLTTLVEWVEPLIAGGGQLLALKGRSVHDELIEARRVLDLRGLEAEPLTIRESSLIEPVTVLRARRVC